MSSGNIAGGFAAYNSPSGYIASSYSAGAVTGNLAGGFVGQNIGSVNFSYTISTIMPSPNSDNTILGGFAGTDYIDGDGSRGEVDSSYWQKDESLDIDDIGEGSADGIEGKTTAELQEPTGYTGIYAEWLADFDNADGDFDETTGVDDVWDFGTSSQYPELKADLDDSGHASWWEFGPQHGRPAPTPTPDLIVDAPSVSSSSPAAGESFTLSVTVRNRGDKESSFTTLRYYRSTDATITTSDTSMGSDQVGSLDPSGSSPESIGLTAPSTPGTYYYGACVDADSDETDATNNCSTAVTVTVGGTPATWGAIRSFSPSYVEPEGQLVVTIEANNYGPFGGVTEVLPPGFDYVTSSLDSSAITFVEFLQHQEVTFTLLGVTSFTYTVVAPSTTGTYSFSGVLTNSERGEVPVGGALTIAVTAGDPLIVRYDANNNGTIEKNEVIAAINDYLFGGTDITKADVIRLINLYLFG